MKTRHPEAGSPSPRGRRPALASLGVAVVFGASACRSEETSAPPVSPNTSSSTNPTHSPDAGPPFELPQPPADAFVVDERFPDCIHPGVASQCNDGWCRIPAGCFIWGSPESEPRRSESREQQAPTILTHDFEISQYETTLAEWRTLGFEEHPIPSTGCTEARCPIDRVSWSHMVTYANALSLAHDPPLEPCYVIEGCRMFRGSYTCGCIPGTNDCPGMLAMNAETAYACEGYRLPTRAEWQYAARAGTTTTYYSGPMTVTGYQEDHSSECEELRDVNLDPIAWYCVNSGGVMHLVGGRLPNAWGLYDMLGNAHEFTHDADQGRSPEPMQEDPFGEIGTLQDTRVSVGGAAHAWPSLLRIASGLGLGADLGGPQHGFRLARTLGPGKVPTVEDLPGRDGPD